MYPWIASPAMAKVVAFEMMRAEHAASQQKSRPQRAAAQDAPADVPAVTAVKTRRPRWVARALHLAH
jgi:hypothetical protein